jgi:hypothetical protein
MRKVWRRGKNRFLDKFVLYREHTKKKENPMGVKILFTIIFVTNLMINMDHGIIPAATEEVRRNFGVKNSQLGIMGSIVYLGLVFGKQILSD